MHKIKSLLIKLTHGLYEEDSLEEEQPLLQEWLENGFLTHKNGIYRFHSKYRAGTLGLVQKGTAYLNVIGENVKDLYIESVGNATEGDLVIAKRVLGKRGTPSATIAAVVGREESFSIAYVQEKDGKKALLDLKTDHPVGVEITQEELDAFALDELFQIDNQTHTIAKSLGSLHDPKVDEKIVLAQYNKHDAFDEEVLKIARSFTPVDAKKHPNRKDLRHLPFCTIDPVTAKDFDDAIYWDDAKSTLYVAIADVSHYVLPFGALDNEAIYRGFSIYLPHRSIPMLPRELSETLCSLQPHVDRLAYLFEIKLDRDTLEVEESQVYEAIIHSQRRFNYEEIDRFFEGELQPQNTQEATVLAALKQLRTITDRLKAKRLENGFEFHSTEIAMELDANTNLIATTVAQETPSHALIEDCMLLANKEAAKRYDRGLFRIHEPPSQSKLQALYQELSAIGIHVDIKNSIKETIEAIQDAAKEMGLESEVDQLIIRAQMQARYTPLNSGHFGLGFEEYTHFTSPIRRYSDLIVHRLLKAIAKNDKEEGAYVLRNIETLAMMISEKEREASSIEVEYKARKYARWAAENRNKEFRAKIIATDPEFKAEIQDTIIGAQVQIIQGNDLVLFEDVYVRIERVDIARAKIFGSVERKVNDV